MATTNEDVKSTQDDFAEAFNEESPAKAEQTEDQAFGLDIEEAVDEEAEEGSADGAPIDAVILVDAGGTEAEAIAEDAEAEVVAEAAAEEATDPKDIQRQKSWEGRLRAEESRLKALAADLERKAVETVAPVEEVASDALDEAASQASAEGNEAMSAKVEKVAEQVEDGDISVDEAVKMLSEDFGEPFVKMIEAIAKSHASKTAAEKVGELEKNTTDIIDHLKSRAAREHFKAIESAHPDFADIAKDPAFEAWKAQDPERAEIASAGSAEDINAMLDSYKAESAQAPAGEPAQEAAAAVASGPVEATDEVTDDELDAAEGVRSAGMQLPEEPAASDDYAGAWEEFADKDRKTA